MILSLCCCAVGDVLVVHLLRHGQQAGGGLGRAVAAADGAAGTEPRRPARLPSSWRFGGLGLGFGLGRGLVLLGLDGCRDLFHHRCGGCGAGRRAGAGFGELLAQLVVLLVQAPQFDDDLVQEVVNFVLVVAFAELGRLKALVDNVFWRQSHLVTSLV